jgi:phage terminase large subunit-like protein
MAELRVELHEKQLEIYQSPARNRVVAAGRQSGKTHLAVADSMIATLADTSWGGEPIDHTIETAYIYPTFEQGRKVVWPRLKASALSLGAQPYENTGLLTFPNGRRLRLLGADNPDSIRGYTWSNVVLDEYKDMLPNVWPEIIRPALAIVRGRAMFIGTPKGKNHFYDLWKFAGDEQEKGNPEWAAFTFTSAANPKMTAEEMLSMTGSMSSQLIRQEIEASFISHGGHIFKSEWFRMTEDEPTDGMWAVAVDLAGFTKTGTGRSSDYEKRDETAIAIVKVGTKGWWVKEIRHGRWEVRETALQILQACKSVGVARVGIEKGALMAAVVPYLTDLMRQYGRWLEVIPLTHGNRDKRDRIQWALQGRAERGLLTLNYGPWTAKLIDQACDFPDPRSHDDLLDALAYIDQMATTVYFDDFEMTETWKPLDRVAGY